MMTTIPVRWKMPRATGRLACAVAVLCAACSNPSEVDSPPQQLIVQAFLSPGTVARVTVKETIPPDEFYDGLDRLVSGADVQISTTDRTVTLSEDAEDPGIYWSSLDALPIVEGQTYHVQISDGRRQLRAQTTVPRRAEVTEVVGDTIVYRQIFGDLFGDLVHPGEFSWSRSPDAAGYVIIVEAVDVKSLSMTADPLTADLDSLIAQRDRALDAGVSADSLVAIERRVSAVRGYFEEHVSLVSPQGDTLRFLGERDQEDWDKIADKDWTEGRTWRERRDLLYWSRVIDYWIPADSTRSDFWWAGVRFEGKVRVRLQAADMNYFDYATTAFNGFSGADSDEGPSFHVDGGTGVFGSYTEDSFLVESVRAD